MFVNICMNTENGVKQPQGIKMISDGIGIECIILKMCDKVTDYSVTLP